MRNTVKQNQAAVFKAKYRQCCMAAACIAGATFSLLLSPVVNYSSANGSTASGILLSIVTWALVLSGAVLTQRICAFGAYTAAGDKSAAGERYRRSRIGLLTAAANIEGLAAEVMFAAGLVLWILRAVGAVYFEGPARMLQYSLTSCGLLLHCFFNGKNYIYIKQGKENTRRRGAHE